MFLLVRTFLSKGKSQQEPRLLSHYSQDENMITAYKQGKDLYATIASGVYKMGYWDCMERYEDGSPNPEGKKRRQSVKAILLGRPKRFRAFTLKMMPLHIAIYVE